MSKERIEFLKKTAAECSDWLADLYPGAQALEVAPISILAWQEATLRAKGQGAAVIVGPTDSKVDLEAIIKPEEPGDQPATSVVLRQHVFDQLQDIADDSGVSVDALVHQLLITHCGLMASGQKRKGNSAQKMETITLRLPIPVVHMLVATAEGDGETLDAVVERVLHDALKCDDLEA